MIKLIGIGKTRNKHKAVDSVSLMVPGGHCVSLFGPSGCGKTTTLRLIAGLERPDKGEIRLDNRLVSDPEEIVAPHQRSIGMVFQDLALWPHMTVFQHLDFVLKSKIRNKDRRRWKIEETLLRFRLHEHPSALPSKLSGGERQRLAIARALAPQPDILLLDEPLSSLDSVLRSTLIREIKDIITTTGITAVYVSHEWNEAVFMADRIAIMNNGRIEKEVSDAAVSDMKYFCTDPDHSGPAVISLYKTG